MYSALTEKQRDRISARDQRLVRSALQKPRTALASCTLRPFEPSPRKTLDSRTRSDADLSRSLIAAGIRNVKRTRSATGSRSTSMAASWGRRSPVRSRRRANLRTVADCRQKPSSTVTWRPTSQKTAGSRLNLAMFGGYFERGIPCKGQCRRGDDPLRLALNAPYACLYAVTSPCWYRRDWQRQLMLSRGQTFRKSYELPPYGFDRIRVRWRW
jgi:hypothetical protein